MFEHRHVSVAVACSVLLSTAFARGAGVRADDPDARRTAATDELFAPLRGDRPGCAAGVFRAGKVAYTRAFGMANVELGSPLKPETVFALDSMSKQFTALCVILLSLRSKLSLDDDVRKYLPELPDYGATIRISHLLHHTSGLKDAGELMILAGYRPPFDVQTRGAYEELIVRQHDLNFVPGTEFLYSDSNFFLLGLIVERVSGKSLAAFARDEIFTPLGMSHTEIRDDASRIIPDRATQYNKSYDPSPFDGKFHNADSHVEALGADGVFSTLDDLARWDGNFYRPVVGGQRAIDLMLETATLSDGSPNDYAAGLYVGTFHGARKIEHSGGGAGSDSEMIRFPDQRLTIAVLCNVRDEDPEDHALTAVPLTRKMLEIWLEALASPPPAAPQSTTSFKPSPIDAATITPYTGLFWNGRFDRLYRLSIANGQLVLTPQPDGQPLHLAFGDDGKFHAGPLTVAFNDERTEITAAQPGTPERHFVRVQETPTGATGADLAGDYYSVDVDATWRLATYGDRLILRMKNFPDETLRPAFRDAYLTDRGLLRVLRDNKGAVTGFEVGNARVFRVGFRKLTASAVPQARS